MNMAPLYEHDSECCTYLGRHLQEEGPYRGLYDLYYCPQMGRPTILARWSSSGPDYYSGLEFRGTNPILGEAFLRALEHDLDLKGARL